MSEDDFDRDFESPFVIPSREIGRPFPQGVGGERIDRYIAERFAQIRRRQNPPAEHSQEEERRES